MHKHTTQPRCRILDITMTAWQLRPLLVGSLVALNLFCLSKTTYGATPQVTADINGIVNIYWNATQDTEGTVSVSYAGLYPDVTVSFDLPVISVAANVSPNPQYWSSPWTWDQGKELILNTTLQFTNIVLGALTNPPSILPQTSPTFNTLQNIGPTEQTIAIPFLTLGGIEAGIAVSPAVTLKYDVTIPTGANVLVDQPIVIIEHLSVQSGGLLDVNPAQTDFRVKSPILNNGTISINGGSWMHSNELINQGDLNSYGGLFLKGSIFNLGGTISAYGGSEATLLGPLNNQGGVIQALTGSTMTLQGITDNHGGILQALSGSTLQLSGTLDNTGGAIKAEGGSLVTLQSTPEGTLNNTTGTIQANNGSKVVIRGVVDNSGGMIQALDGAVVQLGYYAAINGGSIYSAPGSRLEFSGVTLSGVDLTVGGKAYLTSGLTNILDGVTVLDNAELEFASGGNAVLSNTINNNGMVLLNPVASQDGSVLFAQGPLTLSGTGKLVMSDSPGNVINTTLFNGSLINEAGHTIQGSGTIYGSIDNRGLIETGGPTNNPLSVTFYDVYGGVGRNTGTIQANNGSKVVIRGVVDNTGGMIQALDGAVVQLGAAINGGSIYSAPGSQLEFSATTISGADLTIGGKAILASGWDYRNSLDGFTVLNGAELEITSGGYALLKNTVTNNGTIQLNDAAAQGTLIYAAGPLTLSGTGKLVMSDSPGNVINTTLFNGSLINEAGHTIQGSGTIYGSINNRGLIETGGPTDSPLSVTFNDVYGGVGRNTGTIQANDGTRLVIMGGLDNTGGTIQAIGVGTVVELSSAYVDKGKIAVGKDATILFETGSSFINGLLENYGLVQAESALIANGVTVNLMGGTLRAPSIEILHGALYGSGTIDGTLELGEGSIISPGFSPGNIILTGDVLLNPGANVLLEVASADAYDRLTILGEATFSGTIDLVFLAGYVPTAGESYSFLTAALGADFSGLLSFNVSGLPDGYEFHTDFGDHNLVFYADGPAPVPEPQTYMMLIIGLFLVYIAAQRRRVAVY